MDVPTWLTVPKKEIAERLMDFQHFLFCFSLVLFADTYLLTLYGTDIRAITFAWIATHLTAPTSLAFMGALLFFYSTFVPGIQMIGTFISGFRRKETYARQEGYISLDELTNFAMRHNNTVIYQEVQTRIKHNKKMVHFHAVCIALVCLAVAAYFVGSATNEGLVQFLYFGIEKLPWYLEWPLKAITVPPMLVVLLIAIASNNPGANYMYMREFDKWDTAQTKGAVSLVEELSTNV